MAALPDGPTTPGLEKGHSAAIFRRPRRAGQSYSLSRRALPLGLILVLFIFLVNQNLQMPPGLLVRVVAYWIHRGSNPLDPAILDVTRSRIHKAVMRPSVTYELHSLQSTGVFAEWYGNPGEVGPSPFDYNISPEWQASMRGKEKWAAVFNTCKLPSGISLRTRLKCV